MLPLIGAVAVYRLIKGIQEHDDFQPFRMVKDHYSREWDDAPMPNSIFFTKEGHAIHGTYEVRNLGRPVSHGCVRVPRDFALGPMTAAPNGTLVRFVTA